MCISTGNYDSFFLWLCPFELIGFNILATATVCHGNFSWNHTTEFYEILYIIRTYYVGVHIDRKNKVLWSI